MGIQYIKATTWNHLDKSDKDKALCIVPVSSLEQHGKHLPLGTDDYILQHSLNDLMKKADFPTDVWVYPSIRYGSSVEHVHFPGTVSVSLQTLLKLVAEVVQYIARAGFKNILLLNSHGGNTAILQASAQELRAQYGVRIFNLDYWASDFFSFASEIIDADLKTECHGGEIETSLMDYWEPKLVFRDHITEEDINQISRPCPYDFGWLSDDLSKSGIIGDARKASYEKGKRLAEKMTEELQKAIQMIIEEIAR